MYTYVCLYEHIHMAISCVFLRIKLSPVVPVVCCVSLMHDFVCVMCKIKVVLCGGFNLCCVRASACAICGL